jgi:hypothetical protein
VRHVAKEVKVRNGVRIAAAVVADHPGEGQRLSALESIL